MKTTLWAGIILLATMMVAQAQTNDLAALLQQGLLEEQAYQNLDAAIVDYQSLAAKFDQDRKLAATAVFRIGECYRMQGRTNEAAAQYERVLRDFSDQKVLATLSQENLKGMGVILAERLQPMGNQIASGQELRTVAPAPAADEEDKEISRIQELIQNSPDLINEPAQGGNTELANAAGAGRLKVAAYLVEHGAEVNSRANNTPPLIAATFAGNRAMVEFLLGHGADVNARGPNGTTALHIAAEKNFAAVTEALLANKAEVNAQNGSGATPLSLAAKSGQEKILQMLLAARANPNLPDKSGVSSLSIAAQNGSAGAVKALLATGADPNAMDHGGHTVLEYAILGGASLGVRLLLDAKADPNGGELDKPLFAAICMKDTWSADMLLSAGANANAPGIVSSDLMENGAISGMSADFTTRLNAIRYAAMASNPNDFRAHEKPKMPLWLAINMDQLPMVQLLLKYKANPDDTQMDGQSLLFKALKQPPVLAAMLDAGAKVDAVSAGEEELTPLGMAAEQNLAPAVDMLLQHGANPNVYNRNGVTPLHAAEYGMADEKVFELLLAHGANPNVRTGNGRTPLDELKNRVDHDAYPEYQARAVVLADFLRRHGALDRLPDWDRITVSRPADKVSGPVFYQGKNSWNHFTLIETIFNAYRSAPGPLRSDLPGSVYYNYLSADLPFPDLAHITIVRPSRDLTNETRIVVNLLNATNDIDFSRDVPLEFGDVVEIPERDHALNENASGLTLQQVDDIADHLRGKIQLVVKGQATELEIYSEPRRAYLKKVLGNSGAQKVLLASSDLSQVKVTRHDSKTGKKLEWTLDCTPPPDSETANGNRTFENRIRSLPMFGGENLSIQNAGIPRPPLSPVVFGGGTIPVLNASSQNDESSSSDLWLRDGDVVEVPEK